MNLDLIKQLAELLATAEQKDRLELTQRALLIANGVARLDEMGSFSFDYTGTWNEPGRTWNDGGSWGGGKGTVE